MSAFLRYCRALGIIEPRQVQSPQAWIDPSAKIGVRSIISPGAWIGPDVTIGSDCQIGPNAVIGGPGFGYENNGSWVFREHPFGVSIGNKVSVGACTVIDRGRHRKTSISSGTKIDAHCFIAHNVQIGYDCLVIANSMIAGSCEIDDDCWIGPSAQLSDHVTVGTRSRIGLGSVVLHNVPDGEVWVGNPARFLRKTGVTSNTKEAA